MLQCFSALLFVNFLHSHTVALGLFLAILSLRLFLCCSESLDAAAVVRGFIRSTSMTPFLTSKLAVMTTASDCGDLLAAEFWGQTKLKDAERPAGRRRDYTIY